MRTFTGLLTAALVTLFFTTDSEAQTINGFTIPSLVPIPETVTGIADPSLSLNSQWDFTVDRDGYGNHSIGVPGEWEMQGFTVNEGETAIYSRTLPIPADWKGYRVRIRFDAVSSWARVRINGQVVGEHEGSFVPFEVDITPALTYANDRLVVEVRALTISDRLACTSQYACHTVGGLLRKVTLFATPTVTLESNTATTSFDKNYKDATLSIRSGVSNRTEKPARVELLYTLTDVTGKVVTTKKSAMEVPSGTVEPVVIETSLKVRSPRHWDPEHPYLYQLTTQIRMDGKVIQSVSRKTGFRQIEIDGNRLLVNGKPVKLHGVNRHSVHPLTGRSLSPELDRKDAQLFRDANCNYIRTSHYPPSEEFLDAADELGLFVESEASLCWIQHHASPIWKLWNYLDNKFLPYMVRANTDNILAGRDHPSVIIWSLGNESRWSPLWETVHSVVKQLDPTRPTSFHDQCWGGFNNARSQADIANYHYPGINGPQATDTMSRPTLFGEYAHLTTYNRRELLTDPGVRSAYNAPLVMFYDSIYAHDGNLGGAIWSGIDDIFHLPDGRIVGYGPWGPIDAWRRPKPEYTGMRKAYSPIRIQSTEKTDNPEGAIILHVENRYDFTSLKEVTIKVNRDGVISQVASDIPPHGKGTIHLPVGPDYQEVLVTFTDPRGFIAAEERITRPASPRLPGKPAALSMTEAEESLFVRQGDLSFSISRTTGIITSASRKGTVLMTRGPVFGITPMNSDNGGKPNVAGETYQNNIVPLKNYPLYTLFAKNIQARQDASGIRVTMDVSWLGGSGRQSYLFTPDSRLVTTYEITYSGPDTIPYQYGLMVELPERMDRLSWKRDGEFSVFPTWDIGRNEGSAMLNARHMPEVEAHGAEPAGDWKDDANNLGSNDFRSTRRFIREASLSDSEGNRITAISDGKQASRCWRQDSRIQWIIADYSNSGSEPFYGTPHTDGRIRIRNKLLTGTLTLSFD